MMHPRETNWSGNIPSIRQRGIAVVPRTYAGDVTVQVQGRRAGDGWDSSLAESTTSVTLRSGESGAKWVDDGTRNVVAFETAPA